MRYAMIILSAATIFAWGAAQMQPQVFGREGGGKGNVTHSEHSGAAVGAHAGARSQPGAHVEGGAGVNRGGAAISGRAEGAVAPRSSAGARVDGYSATRPRGSDSDDQWRYRWSGDRWWYWTPANRWMWYRDPGGWVYYDDDSAYDNGDDDAQHQYYDNSDDSDNDSSYYQDQGYYRPGVGVGVAPGAVQVEAGPVGVSVGGGRVGVRVGR